MRLLLRQIIKIGKHSSFLQKQFSKTRPTSTVAVMSETNSASKQRYDGRSKKRQWEERRTDKGEGLEAIKSKKSKDNDSSIKGTVDKIKRRKYTLLMGYSGVDYFGMQRNPNTKTIEEDLFKALLGCKFINEECYNQVQNMQFQRAARTDKGVSAVRQVVSLKLGEDFDISKVNDLLPETIRLFGFKRVTKGFNSKSQCDARTYIYVLPTVAFADQNDEMDQKSFRISEETLKKLNEALQLYVGTKNFHNFTLKKKHNDPSAKRYIKSFICESPFLRKDVEFCVLKVYGQSFMMHQIRKMIGLVLAVVRGMATKEIIIKALSDEKVNIPRAPGLGLVLEYVHYERYNNRYGSDGMHEKLTWEEAEKDIEDFKEKHIYPTIINTELESEAMVNWIKIKLSRHSYDDLEEKDDSDDEVGADDDVDNQETSPPEEAENVNKEELKVRSITS